jgi:hypothetical protein
MSGKIVEFLLAFCALLPLPHIFLSENVNCRSGFLCGTAEGLVAPAGAGIFRLPLNDGLIQARYPPFSTDQTGDLLAFHRLEILLDEVGKQQDPGAQFGSFLNVPISTGSEGMAELSLFWSDEPFCYQLSATELGHPGGITPVPFPVVAYLFGLGLLLLRMVQGKRA